MVAREVKDCRTPALTCIYSFFFFFHFCETVGRLSSCRGGAVGLAPTLEFFSYTLLSVCVHYFNFGFYA